MNETVVTPDNPKPSVYLLLPPGKQWVILLRQWLSHAVSKYQPGTVRSYLMSLLLFYKFLTQERRTWHAWYRHWHVKYPQGSDVFLVISPKEEGSEKKASEAGKRFQETRHHWKSLPSLPWRSANKCGETVWQFFKGNESGDRSLKDYQRQNSLRSKRLVDDSSRHRQQWKKWGPFKYDRN